MSVATVPVPMALDYASISRTSSEHDVLMDPWIEAEEHYRYPVTKHSDIYIAAFLSYTDDRSPMRRRGHEKTGNC